MRYARQLALGLALPLAVTAASVVQAHTNATGVTKERMDMMQHMADAMKAIGGMFKGETPFEPAIIVKNAAYLADHAMMIPGVTPKGSNDHPSEALPAIWQDWDGYVASATELADEGKLLVDLAGAGADPAVTRAQYAKVGKTCSSCHDLFRKPKE